MFLAIGVSKLYSYLPPALAMRKTKQELLDAIKDWNEVTITLITVDVENEVFNFVNK
jgi:hypothetical protein